MSIAKELDKELILSLSEKGKLDYYPKFARPFFKFDFEDKSFNIKGVEGNTHIRLRVVSKLLLEKTINIINNL